MSKFHTHATLYFRLVTDLCHADYHQDGRSVTDSNLACRTADHHTEVSGRRYVSVSFGTMPQLDFLVCYWCVTNVGHSNFRYV